MTQQCSDPHAETRGGGEGCPDRVDTNKEKNTIELITRTQIRRLLHSLSPWLFWWLKKSHWNTQEAIQVFIPNSTFKRKRYRKSIHSYLKEHVMADNQNPTSKVQENKWKWWTWNIKKSLNYLVYYKGKVWNVFKMSIKKSWKKKHQYWDLRCSQKDLFAPRYRNPNSITKKLRILVKCCSFMGSRWFYISYCTCICVSVQLPYIRHTSRSIPIKQEKGRNTKVLNDLTKGSQLASGLGCWWVWWLGRIVSIILTPKILNGR